MNISENRGPIATKFYLKHHWVGEKDASGFGPDRIRTLVSMATDSSHRVLIRENVVNTLSPSFLVGSFSFFTGNEDNHNISDKFEFGPDSTKDCGVRCR